MDKQIILLLSFIVASSGFVSLNLDEENSVESSDNPNVSFEEYSSEFDFVSTPFQLQYIFSSTSLLEFKPRVYFFGENIVYEIDRDSPGFNERQLKNTSIGKTANYSLKGGFSVDPLLVSNISKSSNFRSVKEVAGRKCYEYRVQIKDNFNQGFAGSSNKTLDTCLDQEHRYVARVEASSTSNITGEEYNDWVYSVEEFSYGVPENLTSSLTNNPER